MLHSIENTADRRATDGWDGWDDVADHTQVRQDGLDSHHPSGLGWRNISIALFDVSTQTGVGQFSVSVMA
jgi:hypothetical protein